jgi:hypothetical protein
MPKQLLSLLASQFWHLADMSQYRAIWRCASTSWITFISDTNIIASQTVKVILPKCLDRWSWGLVYMLQAGRSRVRVPMRWIKFFNLPNHSRCTKALRFIQRLTEISKAEKCLWEVEHGRCVRLTTYHHLWAYLLSRQCRITSHTGANFLYHATLLRWSQRHTQEIRPSSSTNTSSLGSTALLLALASLSVY